MNKTEPPVRTTFNINFVKEYIIKNMLYMVELNPKNVRICRQIFGKESNIITSDFLSDKTFFHDFNKSI